MENSALLERPTVNETSGHRPELALAADLRKALRGTLLLQRHLDGQSPLTSAHASLLDLIRDDPQRVSWLARELGIRVPSVTEQVIRLERNGMVQRAPDPTDSRAVLVAITPRGRKVLEEDLGVRVQALSSRLGLLSEAERDALAAAIGPLTKLVADLV